MKAILKSVSRSFYLTIQLLPRPLREPIGLAYLLARATDTIADTAEISADLRLTTLEKLARVMAGEEEAESIAAPLRDFATRQSNPAEKALIENLDGCLEQLAAMVTPDREDIRALLQTIVRGQRLDVQRFGDPAGGITTLRTADELDEYTYLVAGCVGEFWTKLGFRHLLPFASRPPNEISNLGIEYGKGLQLINILRDRGADLRVGRAYLPADELAASTETDVFLRWLAKAEQGIGGGIDYCAALTSWRMRFATALPALIGARTIALLREAGAESGSQKIKVSRPQVRRILIAALLASTSPLALRVLYERLARKPVDTIAS